MAHREGLPNVQARPGCRPIYHHLRESIEAHQGIVVAALAVSHYIETQTGWSIKKFVRTARRYRTVKIKAGRQILTAADPLPDDLREAIAKNGRKNLNTRMSQLGPHDLPTALPVTRRSTVREPGCYPSTPHLRCRPSSTRRQR